MMPELGLTEKANRKGADLSVFGGPVVATDIAAVVDADAPELVIGPLADLVERSLVVADIVEQPTRYRLLETVRACVAPRRSPGLDEAHARHVAAVLVEAADRLRTPDEPAAVMRIDGLAAEIRTAHRWCREHDLDLAAMITASLLHHARRRPSASATTRFPRRSPPCWRPTRRTAASTDELHSSPRPRPAAMTGWSSRARTTRW